MKLFGLVLCSSSCSRLISGPILSCLHLWWSSYAVTQYYDGFNRPSGVAYPTGYVAANGYNEYGQLVHVSDSTGATLWAANDSDSLGDVTQFTLGHGVITNKAFDQDTGLYFYLFI